MTYCLLCNSEFKAKINYQKLFSLQKERDTVLCLNCKQTFQQLPKDRCQLCCQAMAAGDKKFCLDCRYWQQVYAQNTMQNDALYRYNDAFRDLMVRYKRYGDYILCQVLAELVASLPSADFYVPLPTSPEHQQKRKFDTISAIFEQLVPLTYALEKNDQGGAQGEKNRQQRLATQQTFQVKSKITLKGEVLLLDDIYTTGRTMYHARDALQTAFPDLKIKSFAIAR